MSNKPIIPIFSGERMHGETIEGHYFRDTWMDSHEITLQDDDVQSTHHIKPETLRISLDNGTTWASMEEVREALEFKRAHDAKQSKRWCKTCGNKKANCGCGCDHVNTTISLSGGEHVNRCNDCGEEL